MHPIPWLILPRQPRQRQLAYLDVGRDVNTPVHVLPPSSSMASFSCCMAATDKASGPPFFSPSFLAAAEACRCMYTEEACLTKRPYLPGVCMLQRERRKNARKHVHPSLDATAVLRFFVLDSWRKGSELDLLKNVVGKYARTSPVQLDSARRH
eukprot:1150291-Pelagomonas_calceolata.AAC.2